MAFLIICCIFVTNYRNYNYTTLTKPNNYAKKLR